MLPGRPVADAVFADLAPRIDALIRRSQSDSTPSQLAMGDLRIDMVSRRVEREGKTVALQAREFRLLA